MCAASVEFFGFWVDDRWKSLRSGLPLFCGKRSYLKFLKVFINVDYFWNWDLTKYYSKNKFPTHLQYITVEISLQQILSILILNHSDRVRFASPEVGPSPTGTVSPTSLTIRGHSTGGFCFQRRSNSCTMTPWPPSIRFLGLGFFTRLVSTRKLYRRIGDWSSGIKFATLASVFFCYTKTKLTRQAFCWWNLNCHLTCQQGCQILLRIEKIWTIVR